MKDATPQAAPARRTLRFDRNELAGAFGDIGTDLPLLTGMLAVSGLLPANVLTMFGILQIASGLFYRLPIPVQPLKAVAALVISQRLAPPVILGAGLSIGVFMLVLSLTGFIDWCARVIPKAVIRGIQFGLGLKLCLLACQDYIGSDGLAGYVLAAIAFSLVLILSGNRKVPPALILIGAGIAYSLLFRRNPGDVLTKVGLATPSFHLIGIQDVWRGFILLAVAQIPLSLGNSLLATRQLVSDFFPGQNVSLRKLGFTYSLMNIVAAFFGGIPVCHGAGGLAGHYAFGARTGGSVIIYGSLYLTAGLFLSGSASTLFRLFPLPLLGVLLLFEGAVLMSFLKEFSFEERPFFVALLTGVVAAFAPYGFLVALLLGTLVSLLPVRVPAGAGILGVVRER